MKQPLDLQFIFVIDVIDNKVGSAIKVDFVCDPLVDILWKLG